MRIQKTNSNSNSNSKNSSKSTPVVASKDSGASITNKYSEAIDYIHSAISALSNLAKDDAVAKESIANLSVVLLDLQSEDN